jgi:type VI secretion system protein ImpK
MEKKTQDLQSLCEPLFQYVCRLNRTARRGVNMSDGQVRSELKSLLSDLQMQAHAAGLSDQFGLVRLPLIGFADFMVRESKLPFARNWRSLAEEEKQLGLDQRFFEMLDETLADQSDKATERLAIFHTCIGLGFTGMYTGQPPDVLRRKQLEITARIKPRLDTDPAARITPEAYDHTDKRVLQQPIAQGVLSWVIVLVGLTVGLLVTNFTMFNNAKSTLDGVLQRVITQAGHTPAPEGATTDADATTESQGGK